MDGQNIVAVRIRFAEPDPDVKRKTIVIRRGTVDPMSLRNQRESVIGVIKQGWILIPLKGDRGLPEKEWEEFWGDENFEVDVWLPSSSEWKTIKDWKTIRRLARWEKRNARNQIPNAAE